MLWRYVIKRLLIAIPTLLVISFIVFCIIQLPPGSFLDWKMEQMKSEGQVDETEIQSLRDRYHFEQPVPVQYLYWIKNFVMLDFGKSFATDIQVSEILADTVPFTVAISLFTILFTWALSIPFGIIAAVKKNTAFDYILTFIGLAALATPVFSIALVFQVMMQHWWPNFSPTGITSHQFQEQSWFLGQFPFVHLAKLLDLGKHLLVPVVILALSGTAGQIRILRANMIDELKKQYVLCARARGLHPALVVLRYPFRVAINPFMSSIGLILPAVISGSLIISIVLSLPTLGPVNLAALQSQDIYLAASVVFIQCILAVVGILISDVLLAMVDPRIKFEAK